MHLDEIEKELFEQIINEFLDKYENGREILTEVRKLHLKLRKVDSVVHYPSYQIAKILLQEKIKIPVAEGGYSGLSIEEIAEKEKQPVNTIRRMIED